MTPRQTRHELSEAGSSRKVEMLNGLQESMTSLHRRRHIRYRCCQLAGVVALMIPICIWIYAQALAAFEPHQNAVVELEHDPVSNERERSESDLDQSPHRSVPSNRQANAPNSLNEPAKHSSPHRSKKSLIEKYVVTTADVEKREMEFIDDAEMLELLKQAGVEGWIAEINDQQVVLNSEGKRL